MISSCIEDEGHVPSEPSAPRQPGELTGAHEHRDASRAHSTTGAPTINYQLPEEAKDSPEIRAAAKLLARLAVRVARRKKREQQEAVDGEVV